MLRRAWLPILVLCVAGALLLLTPSDTRIVGLDHGQFAQAAFGGALVLGLLPGAASRLSAAKAIRVGLDAALWALIFLGVVALYAYRSELTDVVGRIAAEIAPGEPQVGAGGEVVVNRRLGGDFVVSARVNGARASMLFDTGASSVVLTADDARRAGVNPVGLDYSVTVTTANGAAQAAEVRLKSVAVGPIVETNVRALVARPGALDESLLGMSFLERLKSYGVERGRLVLRAG